MWDEVRLMNSFISFCRLQVQISYQFLVPWFKFTDQMFMERFQTNVVFKVFGGKSSTSLKQDHRPSRCTAAPVRCTPPGRRTGSRPSLASPSAAGRSLQGSPLLVQRRSCEAAPSEGSEAPTGSQPAGGANGFSWQNTEWFWEFQISLLALLLVFYKKKRGDCEKQILHLL